MNRSPSLAIVASFLWIGLTGSAFVACSDVGDNTGSPGADASDEASGFDATEPDGAEPATGSDAAGSSVDSGTAGNPPGHDGSTDAGVDATVDAGMAPGVDSGTAPGVDSGMDTGTTPPVEAGIDAGLDAGADARADAGIDAGARIDAGVDAGVDAGTDAGVDSGGGGGTCVADCPASDTTNCPNGPIVGIGSPGCNLTEAALYHHSPDCLECALNAFCLHDTEGDNPTATGTSDCDDVPGNDTANPAVTNAQTCLDLLTCELSTGCGKAGILDCYCGAGVSSTACKTAQSGLCIPQVTAGLDSTDPNFIELNLTATAKGNGGSFASKIDTCLFQNCQASCF